MTDTVATTTNDIEQARMILRLNDLAKSAGLPTYTELETQLTELSQYVKHNVSPAAIQSSAQRSINLLTR